MNTNEPGRAPSQPGKDRETKVKFSLVMGIDPDRFKHLVDQYNKIRDDGKIDTKSEVLKQFVAITPDLTPLEAITMGYLIYPTMNEEESELHIIVHKK